MQDIKRILSNAPQFQMLTEGQLASIICGTRVHYRNAETSVIKPGDPAAGMYLIVFGQVRIGFDLKQGGEKTLAILGKDKCFGLGEMFLGQAHLAFVRTTQSAMLLHIDRERMFAAAEENFDFARELMTCVGRQFYTLVRDIENYSRQNSRQRVAGYLLRQRQSRNDNCIELAASKALIASRLSVTPSTLSRMFHELSDEGLISVSGRRVRILDDERMCSLLE